MAKAYSMDLRERVLKDCDTGMRSEDVAQKYTVSASWVYDLRKKRRETGSIASLPNGIEKMLFPGEPNGSNSTRPCSLSR